MVAVNRPTILPECSPRTPMVLTDGMAPAAPGPEELRTGTHLLALGPLERSPALSSLPRPLQRNQRRKASGGEWTARQAKRGKLPLPQPNLLNVEPRTFTVGMSHRPRRLLCHSPLMAIHHRHSQLHARTVLLPRRLHQPACGPPVSKRSPQCPHRCVRPGALSRNRHPPVIPWLHLVRADQHA